MIWERGLISFPPLAQLVRAAAFICKGITQFNSAADDK